MLGKIRKWSVFLFSAVFALLWCGLLFTVTAAFWESKKIGVTAVVCLVLFGLGIGLAWKFFGRFWENRWIWLGGSAALLLWMAAGLLYTGLELRVYPGWDFGAVYQGAVELAENGVFLESSNWYFTTYPNNVMVCMFLGIVFKLFGGFCSYITLGVLLNVFLIIIGIIFFFLLTQYLYGLPKAFLGLFICALFLPFYMHAPIFYTDTFALPFVTGTFLLYQLRKKDSRFLIVTGLFLALGYKTKGSLGVILIALVIHIWLQKDKLGECVKRSIFLVIPFLLVTGFLTVLPGQLSFLDMSEAQKNEFPMEHWLAMGLEESGGYSADVYWMTASVEGKEEKKAVDRAFIRDKLAEYGVSGMLEHIRKKTIFTWGDGVYFAPEKLKRDPMQESWLHSWFLYDGANYEKTYRYCSVMQVLLLFGILGSVVCNMFEKGRTREIQAMQLAVFGLFLFLLLWETRSRYLVNFVPVFVLLGIDTLDEVVKNLDRFKKNERGNK